MRALILVALLLAPPARADFYKRAMCRVVAWLDAENARRKPPPRVAAPTRLIGRGSAPLVAGEINYKVYGSEDKPTIVMVHGYGSWSGTFDAVAERLSERFRVITYDKRGHGTTVARGDDYGSNVAAEDLKALLDHLGVQKATVLGHSLGGRTALRFADRFPDRVDKLVIEDMSFQPLTNMYPYRPDFKARAEAMAALSKTYKSWQGMKARLLELYPEEQVNELMKNHLRKHEDGSFSFRTPPDAMELEYNQGIVEDYTAELKRLKAPMLVYVAQHHSDFTPESLKHLKDNRPDVRVVAIPDSQHTVHRSHPDRFIGELTNFVAP